MGELCSHHLAQGAIQVGLCPLNLFALTIFDLDPMSGFVIEQGEMILSRRACMLERLVLQSSLCFVSVIA